MPTARKQPSGNYKVRVYDYTDSSGKQHYKSFTAKRKADAEQMARDWQKSGKSNPVSVTFGQACDDYINARLGVASPRTIEDYKRTKRLYLASIVDVDVNKLTQNHVQRVISEMGKKKLSPKTMSNVHAFISAVMHSVRPDFALNTTLPTRTRPDIYIPQDEDIKKVMDIVAGTALELPVLLAAFGPMRRGEISALDTKDINGTVVHVCRNMVYELDDQNVKHWVIRQPKTYAGDRYIDYPDFVAEKWKDKKGLVTELNPNTITDTWCDVIRAAGLPLFRFHDLRHYSASIQHALGIPDAYIMQRGGWSSDRVLKQIYRHAMAQEAEKMNRIANEHFRNIHDPKHDPKKEDSSKMEPFGMPATGIEPV